MSVCSAFLDDIRNLRANAVLIIGVLTFAVLVWYHSEKLFGDAPPSTTRSKLKLSGGFANIKNEVLDIEKAMTDILANHKGVSQAAELAKMAVREQYELRTKYRAAAIFVFKQQGTNLHLAMRNAAKRNFIKEIVLLHDMSKPVDSFGNPVKEWLKCPKEIYGKPVNYVKSTQPLDELHKFYACASYTKDARTNVCFYQAPARDTENYIESMWATFLRSPSLLYTAVGAMTYYNDAELTFREDAYGIDAGFAYLNAGALFLKSHAVNFVKRIEQLQVEDKTMYGPDVESPAKLYRKSADVFFSLWLNRPPCELSNDIVPYKRQIDEPKVYERNAFARRALQQESHVLALKLLLEQAITYRDGLAKVSRVGRVTNRTLATYRPDAYSSCANDKCLLITNVPAVNPTPTHLNGYQLGTRLKDLLERKLPPQECDVFKAHQYHYAVDGNPSTQWVTTNANISEGDYFGLDLLKLHKDVQNVTVVAAHPFQDEMVVEVSMRGRSWYPVTSRPKGFVKTSWRGFPVTEYVYDLSDSLAAAWQRILELPSQKHAMTPTPPLYIRFLRFRALKDYNLPFIVMDISYRVGKPLDALASKRIKMLRAAGN